MSAPHWINRARAPLARDERGTTIVELMVTMVLLVLLAGAIASLITVAASGQRQSSDRLDAATTEHQLQHWFTMDVQSADRSVLTDPLGTTRACDGIDTGDRLRIAWTDGAAQHVALYRVRSADTGAELIRVECIDGEVRARTVVARSIDGAGAVMVGEDPDHPGSLALSLGVRTGSGVLRVRLSEPVVSLPSGGGGVTTTRPDTSDAAACAVQSFVLGTTGMPATVTAQLSGPMLASRLPIDLRTNGSCGTMAMQVRSASAVVATVPLQHEASTDPLTHRDRYVADVPSGPWQSGTYSVQITDTGAALSGGSGSLVLRRPCWVSRLSVSPNVVNTNGGSKRLLSKDVVISATVDSWCPDLTLAVSPTPPSGVPTLVLAAGSSARTANILGGTGPWNSGTYTVTITGVADAPSVAFTVGATPVCQVTGLSVSPDSVTLRPGIAGTPRGLRQGIGVSVGTMGSCGTLTATVVGGAVVPAPGPYVVGITPIVIGGDPQLAWWPGSYSVHLQSSTATIVGATNAPFEVFDGCSATIAPGWSSKELASTSSRALAFSVTTVSACDALTGVVSPTPPGGGTVSIGSSSTTGPATVDGSIAKTAGWPVGRYTLTVLSGGVSVATATFDIA